MKSRFLLNIVIRQSSPILQLLSGEDQSLLIWRNSFLVLDLGLNVLDAITSLDLQGDGFTGQGLDEDLHTSSKPENQMKSRFLPNIVTGQSSSILQLLSSEDQSLLIWGNSLLVLKYENPLHGCIKNINNCRRSKNLGWF